MPSKQKTEIDIKREAKAPAAPRDMFGALRDEIDRLFDDFAWPGLRFPSRRGLTVFEPMRDWMPALSAVPAMDLVERDGGYELSVELPGMTADDIEVRLTDGALTVKGEKSEETKEEKADYHMSERRYGTIQRTVALPEGIDADKVDAKFENGVMKVTLPKSEKAKSKERKIEVKAG